MLKPKVALVKSGFLPPGSENKRGRLSGEAIAECRRLVSEEGYKIEGYVLSDTPANEKTAPVVEKVKTDPNRILDIPEYPLRDEREWEAYANINGKLADIGMRTIEETCGNSLTYCGCRNPVVRHLDSTAPVMVNFKARVKPLPNKRW